MLYTSQTLEQLEHIAEDFAKTLIPPCCLLLYGNLGAGKTTFARMLIQSLTSKDTVVPSPTFTLLQTYDISKNHSVQGHITHFDLYRLHAEDDLLDIGFEEYSHEHICLIEWPERLGAFLPEKYIRIMLEEDSPTTRHLTIESIGFE